MISVQTARKWSDEAYELKNEKLLSKWVIVMGEPWTQEFRDYMTMAQLEAVGKGDYQAAVQIHSPKYRTNQEVDVWRQFIQPDLEGLLQEYEALGFESGASECGGAEKMDWFYASYHVTVDWSYRRRRAGVERVRYA
jgi:hypothetical protein